MISLTNTDFLQNAVNDAYSQLTQPLQRLSTGSQLNSPSDNAADYSIAQSLLMQLNGTEQAETNVENGMSMLQTASGGMSDAADALQTMSSLAIEGGDGILSSSDMNDINMEFQQMNAEVGSIAQNTVLNATPVLNGSSSSVSIQSGTGVGDQTALPTGNITLGNLGLSGAGTQTQAQSESAIASVENALQGLSSQQSNVGAAENGLSMTAESLTNSAVNTASALSQISDADIASEASNLAASKVQLQASIYALSQANRQKGQILNLLA